MFGIGIRYLMGWAMAAMDGENKERAEWPPHPDRVFMALAAAWFETGKDESEGAALRWLEKLSPPQILATGMEARTSTTSYVPVNDTKTYTAKKVDEICSDSKSPMSKFKEAGLSLLPEYRSRQPRSFPVAVPHDPVVHLIWENEIPLDHREGLASLCNKAVSIGHPASVVQMWFSDNPPKANLAPTTGVSLHRLRTFGPGRLQYLEDRCNRETVIEFLDRAEQIKNAKGKEKRKLQDIQAKRFPGSPPVSLRPEPGLWQGYDRPPNQEYKAAPGSLFDPRLVILSISGKKLSLSSTLKLTEALRGALLAHCPPPLPEWLTGHAFNGARSSIPHLSIIPLPFAGSNHADGRLMGAALVLPRNLDPAETERILAPWLWEEGTGKVRNHRLFVGHWLECHASLETRETPPLNLKTETWTSPAHHWATVTPIVLDRHFDGPKKWELAAEAVKDSCERIGLPRPSYLILHPVSMVQGVPRSNEFPWIFRKKDNGRMHHSHAVIIFDQEVQGPVILGAGRFRGYGLCRPLIQGGEVHG